MADRLPELVVLDRFEALAAWVHTQRRDGAVLVPLAAVVELMAGLEPTPGGSVTEAHVAWLRRIADGTGELLMTDAFDEHSPAVAHLRHVVNEVT